MYTWSGSPEENIPMKNLTFANTYNHAHTFICDLMMLTPGCSLHNIYNPLDDNSILVADIRNLKEISQAGINLKQVVGIGHCDISYDNLDSNKMIPELLGYVVTASRLHYDYASRLGVNRKPTVLPYGLHFNFYKSIMYFDTPFTVWLQDAKLAPMLDVRDTTFAHTNTDESVKVDVYIDMMMNIREVCKSICSGHLIIAPDSEYTRMLESKGLCYVIPAQSSLSTVEAVSIALEYVRTNPNFYIKAKMNSYKYAGENIAWNAVYPQWKRYFNEVRSL